MTEKNIEVRQVAPGSFEFELEIPEELFGKLKEAADSLGLTVDSFVSEYLLPTRLADMSRSR